MFFNDRETGTIVTYSKVSKWLLWVQELSQPFKTRIDLICVFNLRLLCLCIPNCFLHFVDGGDLLQPVPLLLKRVKFLHWSIRHSLAPYRVTGLQGVSNYWRACALIWWRLSWLSSESLTLRLERFSLVCRLNRFNLDNCSRRLKTFFIVQASLECGSWNMPSRGMAKNRIWRSGQD